MDDDKKRLFAQYAVTGKYTPEKTLEILEGENVIKDDTEYTRSDDTIRMIGRQLFVYEQLLNNKDCIREYEHLIELLRAEIDNQYKRKSQIETRTGFLIALWGVLLAVVYKEYEMKMLCLGTVSFVGISSVLIILIGFISFLVLMLNIRSETIQFYGFSHRWNDIQVAGKHKELMIMRLLEGYWNSFEGNNRMIEKKARKFNVSVYLMTIYVILIASIFVAGGVNSGWSI